jgi:hypothetical protein
MIPAYPLAWPEGLPRTEKKATAQFKTTLAGAINNVRDSLRLFGSDSGRAVTEIAVTSNATLLEALPDDTGVAVWFTWESEQRCIAVDRYPRIEHNLQAIHHILEARRTELRHGGLTVVRQSFKGFALLPAPDRWQDVLAFPPDATITAADVERQYRALARGVHPDTPTGSHDAMARLNRARTAALQELNSRGSESE